jgi:uncharacterized protein YhfF
MENSLVNQYWTDYQNSLPESERDPENKFVAEQWGDNDKLAEDLSRLIVAGTKTASCSSLWEHEFDGSPIPVKGTKTIVLNGKKEPVCIVETVDVQTRKFDEIDEAFASMEGEGDRSLEYWRKAHWSFFTRVLKKTGKEPAMDMPLVCEKFKVVYK